MTAPELPRVLGWGLCASEQMAESVLAFLGYTPQEAPEAYAQLVGGVLEECLDFGRQALAEQGLPVRGDWS